MINEYSNNSKWEFVKLGQVCKLQNGYAFESSSFKDEGIPIIRISNIENGEININDKIVFTNDVSISKEFSVKKGDLLIAMSGATTGKSGKYKSDKIAYLNQRVGKFVLRGNSLQKDYLNYIIQSPIYLSPLFKNLSVGAQPNIGSKQIEEVIIPLPPLSEQQKIAKILSIVDAKIEVIDQQITETQSLKKGLMQRLLTKGIGDTEFKDSPLGKIPKSWEVVNVDDFILDKKGAMKIGPFGSALKKDSMVANGIKVYGQENIFVRDMSFGDRYITQEHYESLKSCELFPGDFIISMMGTIGKCMVVPTGIEKGIMDSHLLRLQLNLERINADFLKHLFRSPFILNQVNNLSVGGIMAGLSSKIVKDIKFILPTINEQKQFSELFNYFDDKLEVLSEKKTHYQELKKGLMQQLLTGKIRVKI